MEENQWNQIVHLLLSYSCIMGDCFFSDFNEHVFDRFFLRFNMNMSMRVSLATIIAIVFRLKESSDNGDLACGVD